MSKWDLDKARQFIDAALKDPEVGAEGFGLDRGSFYHLVRKGAPANPSVRLFLRALEAYGLMISVNADTNAMPREHKTPRRRRRGVKVGSI